MRRVTHEQSANTIVDRLEKRMDEIERKNALIERLRGIAKRRSDRIAELSREVSRLSLGTQTTKDSQAPGAAEIRLQIEDRLRQIVKDVEDRLRQIVKDFDE